MARRIAPLTRQLDRHCASKEEFGHYASKEDFDPYRLGPERFLAFRAEFD